jgi:hypothetical protein
MPETTDFLAKRLQTEGEKTLAHFAAFGADDWARTIYTEGAHWSAQAVFAHLVTSEQGLFKLFVEIQRGGAGAAEDFDIDRYNARQQEKTQNLTAADLLDLYRTTRAELVAWVASLSEADLQKTGRHPFLGVTTLAEMLKMIYLHNQLHLRDLRRA